MNSLDKLLENLNDEQRRAATHAGSPLMIVAGAGTGKTTVITRRIAWLVLSGLCTVNEVLALTFTQKAAQEMEERLDRLLPYGYVDLWVCTFHGFCERILRKHGLDIGIPTDFKLLDQTAAWMLVRKNLDLLGLEYYRPAGNPTKCIHELLKHFSRCKDEGITPQEYVAHAESLQSDDQDETARIQELARAYTKYQQLLLDESALDFGDLIVYTLKLFSQRLGLLNRYQMQFKAVLVDEFQDTNWAQYELIKLLAANRSLLTVVGDDDQSIYRWRGTSLANITRFKKDYPSSTEIILTRNYRSRQNILDCAYAFIQKNNPNRLECQLQQSGTALIKQLHAHNEGLGTLEYMYCATHDEETEQVIQKICKLKEQSETLQWSDFAILIRSNDSASNFIAKCSEYGIPYQFFGQKGLYSKPAVIDLLSYCTLLHNYHESPALYRVFNFPFLNISHDGIVALSHFAHRKGYSLWQALEHMSEIEAITQADADAFRALCSRIGEHAALAKSKPAVEVFFRIVQDTGFLTWLSRDDTLEKREGLGYINQLFAKLKTFQSEYPLARLQEFLELVRLEQEAGDAGSLARDIDTGPDVVKIMTIHGSKGLEFSYVFVVHLVDRRFPTQEREDALELPQELLKEPIPQEDAHLEEERRLLYVALTRAQEGVFLTGAKDYGGVRSRKPSRFLEECGMNIPAEKPPLSSTTLPSLPPERTATSSRQALALPSTVSFSQLRAFQTCPLQYKYSFLLKIPTFGRYQFSFGKSIHATLEKFLNRIMEERTVPSLDELLNMYKECWIDEWYRSQKEQEEYFAKGSDILERIHGEVSDTLPSPRTIERDFTLKLGTDEDSIILKGKIDRIDDIEGGVEIIDYKTGKSKAEDALGFHDKEQLIMYQMAAEELLGMNPIKLTYYYVEDGSHVSFLGTAKEKEKTLKNIEKTVQEMKGSDFKATPGFHCRFCDFKSICEYKKI
ncbi:MAG: UvrD-helicase domain-containing protein [Patescibacteria group bacterium]